MWHHLTPWPAIDAGEAFVLLVDAAVKVTVVLTAALGLSRILIRSPANIRHVLWGTALVAVMALPLLSSVLPSWYAPQLPDWRPKPVRVGAATTGPLPAANVTVEVSEPSTGVAATSSVPRQPMREGLVWGWVRRVSLSAWVMGIWMLGTGLVLVSWLIGIRRAGKLVSVPVNGSGWSRLIAWGRRQVGLRRRVRVGICDRISAPVTWGVLRPVVLLPPVARSWTEERRQIVVLHEFTHIKRNDWLVHTLGRLACAAYWYNPLVWLAATHLAIERERACDDRVVASGVTPSVYARHLLEIAQSTTAAGLLPAAALTMAQHNRLEGRLMSILGKTNKRAVHRLWAVPILLVTLTVSVAAVRPGWEPRSSDQDRVTISNLTTGPSVGSRPDYDAGGPETSAGPPPHETARADGGARDDDVIRYREGDGEILFHHRGDGVRIRVEIEGAVDLDQSGTTIVRLREGARVLLESRSDGDTFELEIQPGDEGRPEYRWQINGETQPFDDEAREWMRDVLSIFRTNTEMSSLVGRENELRGEINALYGERNTLQGEINSIYGERNALQGALNSHYGELNALQGEINAIYGERNELQGEINAIHGQRNEAWGRLNTVHELRDALKRRLSRLHEERESLLFERSRMADLFQLDGDDAKEMERLFDEGLARLDEAIVQIQEQLESLEVHERVAAMEDDLEREARTVESRIEALKVDDRVREVHERIEALAINAQVLRTEEKIRELDVEERVRALRGQIEALDVTARSNEIRAEVEALRVEERVAEMEDDLEAAYGRLRKMMKRMVD